jgi:hypothetical protein
MGNKLTRKIGDYITEICRSTRNYEPDVEKTPQKVIPLSNLFISSETHSITDSCMGRRSVPKKEIDAGFDTDEEYVVFSSDPTGYPDTSVVIWP